METKITSGLSEYLHKEDTRLEEVKYLVFHYAQINKTIYVYEILEGHCVRAQENFKSDIQLQEHQQVDWNHFNKHYKLAGVIFGGKGL